MLAPQDPVIVDGASLRSRWFSRTGVGLVPIPVYVVLVAVIGAFVALGVWPKDISLMIALLAIGGFTCAELGKRLPWVSALGAAAIFATFIPSYLVYAHMLPAHLVTAITDFTRDSQFLYLYIAAIIVGSVLSMDHRVLVGGFLRIFVPMVAGSLAALVVGTSVGLALGMTWHNVVFFVLLPALGGGVGEGALPLSFGYAAILGVPQGAILAQILPPVMFASLTVILFSGLLDRFARTRPHLTGHGRLQVEDHDALGALNVEPAHRAGPTEIASAGLVAVTLYLVGLLGQTIFKFPGPITMLILALLLNLLRMVSVELKAGSYIYYKFFSSAVTYPLLFAIGVALTPWKALVAAFTPAMVVTIVVSVAALMVAGFATGRWIGLYPVDAAIVTGCRMSQGGTGDVAILTACDRLQLMPFAQIATRIGGAATLTLGLAALRLWH